LLQVDAIVFLVDSADPERFPEAKKELDSLLSEDYLGQVGPLSIAVHVKPLKWEYLLSATTFSLPSFHAIALETYRAVLNSVSTAELGCVGC
jgi:ADP-ribosylation factor family